MDYINKLKQIIKGNLRICIEHVSSLSRIRINGFLIDVKVSHSRHSRRIQMQTSD